MNANFPHPPRYVCLSVCPQGLKPIYLREFFPLEGGILLPLSKNGRGHILRAEPYVNFSVIFLTNEQANKHRSKGGPRQPAAGYGPGA